MHLYYMYKQSSKKLRELKKLYEVLKNSYEFQNAALRPEKSSGTRWIDHKMRAMAKLNDKFGMYVSHLENVIADTSKQVDRAKLQGKYNKLVDASVLLRSAFLSDLLLPAKSLSLISQKSDVDIIQVVNAVQKTQNKFRRWQKKFADDKDEVLNLPTLKSRLENIEDGDKFQGAKLKNFSREKQYVKDHAAHIAENILICLQERYGNLTEE